MSSPSRSSPRRRVRSAALLVAALLVVTGCATGGGGDGDDEVRAEPATPTTEPTPTTTEPTPTAGEDAEPTTAPSADPSPTPTTDPEDLALALEVVADGLDGPVHVFAHGATTLVVEQVGRVRDLESGDVWLDLTDRVRSGGEQGLLGVDVHPEGGHWVAHWTAGDGATTLATYRVGDDGRPDPATEQVVLRVAQPAANHNGGSALFGPDGWFWLALGDGGAAGDRFGNGQDAETLLGALLRLDLDDPDVARVPSDNPFVDGGGAPEVWAWGLRNPYRIDVGDDQVYVTDVGQDMVEEVTVLRRDQAGANLGWPAVEGDRCFRDGCDPGAYEPADVTYTHASVGGGCSIIGGHLYDGTALPGLSGHFLYADLCAGILRTVRAENGDVVAEADLTDQVGDVAGVLGIGGDADGEAVLTFRDGTAARLVPAG